MFSKIVEKMAKLMCLTKEGWLNEKLIHAFQILIKAQYPNMFGLLDPVQRAKAFIVMEHKKFVQVLNRSNNHLIL